MAEIGQYRFTGSGCVQSVAVTPKYKSVTMNSTDSATSTSFQDVAISPATAFIKDQDYYFKVAIPQDMNYEMSFNIKLIREDATTTETAYQFLKNVTVSRGGSGINVYRVVLYGYPVGQKEQTMAAMIPLPYVAGASGIENALYYNESNRRYYLCTGGANYTPTTDVNELSVSASWKTEQGKNFGVFELTFRPVQDGFTSILLEMVRTAEDYSIQHTGPSGVEFGRKVDISSIQTTVYTISNLVNLMGVENDLSRIGVWGHSGLTMVINGEEIKIGPSGYYELDALPIESIGIVAPDNDFSNNFTIDYAYERATGVSG